MQMIAEIYGILRDGLGLAPAAIADVFDRWNEGPLQVLPRRDHRHRLPRHRPRHRPAGRRRHPRPRRPEGHRPLDGDRGPAPRRPGDGDRGGRGGAQHLGAARRAPGRRRALRPHRRRRRRPRRRRPSRPRSSPARSPATPRASASSPPRRTSSAGSCRSTASPGSGAPAASSARRCSTTWRRRSTARPGAEPDVRAALRRPAARQPRPACAPSSPPRRSPASPPRRSPPALGYFDMMRTARSTANLLQAQRDFFGAHGFERIDEPGAHHGPWEAAPTEAGVRLPTPRQSDPH